MGASVEVAAVFMQGLSFPLGLPPHSRQISVDLTTYFHSYFAIFQFLICHIITSPKTFLKLKLQYSQSRLCTCILFFEFVIRLPLRYHSWRGSFSSSSLIILTYFYYFSSLILSFLLLYFIICTHHPPNSVSSSLTIYFSISWAPSLFTPVFRHFNSPFTLENPVSLTFLIRCDLQSDGYWPYYGDW